jgi:hypothetical protein
VKPFVVEKGGIKATRLTRLTRNVISVKSMQTERMISCSLLRSHAALKAFVGVASKNSDVIYPPA